MATHPAMHCELAKKLTHLHFRDYGGFDTFGQLLAWVNTAAS